MGAFVLGTGGRQLPFRLAVFVSVFSSGKHWVSGSGENALQSSGMPGLQRHYEHRRDGEEDQGAS